MARKSEKQLTYRQYLKDRALVDSVVALGLNRQKFGEQLEAKKAMLREYGYSALRKGKGDEFVDLDECKPSRVSHALFNTYDLARKFIDLFEEYCRDCKGNLVELIEAERRIQFGGEQGDLETAREETAIAMDKTPRNVLAELSLRYGQEVLGDYYTIL